MRRRIISLMLAAIMLVGCLATIPTQAEAANTSSDFIVRVYDGGKNYSGRYIIYKDFGNFKAGIFGKKFTIQCVNYLSQLSRSECNYFHNHAKFGVYLYKSNGRFYKYMELKDGQSFKIPCGTYNIVIRSEIASSGWNKFARYSRLWTFAQYRLRY